MPSSLSPKQKHSQRLKIEKRTSIGRDQRPKNKHARKNWKPYRGQGR